MTVTEPNVAQANAFEEVVRARRRPGYTVEPLSIAWDAVAFTLRGQRNGVACVPRKALDGFFDDLDEGRLDDAIESFLAAPPSGRVLRSADQANTPGLFDELASPGAIVPPERIPGRGVRGGFGGGTPADARRNKNRGGPRSRRVLVAAATAVVVIVAAGAVALASRGSSNSKTSTVAAISTTVPPATAASPTLNGTWNVTFTVVSVNVAPGLSSSQTHRVGDTSTFQVSFTCTPAACLIKSSGGPSSMVKSLTATGDHLAGREDSPGDSQCPATSPEVLATVLDVQRDTSGKITGFTGRTDLVHPGGVEEFANGTQCSTLDVSSTFVGVPL